MGFPKSGEKVFGIHLIFGPHTSFFDNIMTPQVASRFPLFISVHRFHVGVLPGTKLESGPATLHLCNDILVLARDLPPVVMGQWKLSDLRRYGAVANGFVFEGGTRCGYCKYCDTAISCYTCIMCVYIQSLLWVQLNCIYMEDD